MTATSILLKGGVVLLHDTENHVKPDHTDILIVGNRIANIAKHIAAEDGTEVIDCTNKIISPGFIDTHRHGWQTQLKGRHANEQLMEYMVNGNSQHYQYGPMDVFYGQLAGMLESISAGTTTVIDHAHITRTPEHARLGIAATASSGIRSIFCYTPIMQVEGFNPLSFHANPLESWVMQTFEELADESPFGSGRVTLGFAFDLYFLQSDLVKAIFKQVRAKGVKTITSHGSHALAMSAIQTLHNLELLDTRIIISHGGAIPKADAELLVAKGAFISSTPSTELQMAMGRPYCFDASFQDGGANGQSRGLQDNASLGIDCHSCTAGSIVTEAKLGLQNARNHFNEFYMKQGKFPHRLPDSLSVEAAFNLATIKGAEAASMRTEIGRIAEGFKADLVIFDALSPSMVAGAQHDPVAAVILHSSPADIEVVIIDGIVRKREGRLLPVNIDAGAKKAVGEDTLSWKEIAMEVLNSRGRMQKEIKKIDLEEAYDGLFNAFHVDKSKFV